MILFKNVDRFIAISFRSKWSRPSIRTVVICYEWYETMIDFGFGVLHWERSKA